MRKISIVISTLTLLIGIGLLQVSAKAGSWQLDSLKVSGGYTSGSELYDNWQGHDEHLRAEYPEVNINTVCTGSNRVGNAYNPSWSVTNQEGDIHISTHRGISQGYYYSNQLHTFKPSDTALKISVRPKFVYTPRWIDGHPDPDDVPQTLEYWEKCSLGSSRTRNISSSTSIPVPLTIPVEQSMVQTKFSSSMAIAPPTVTQNGNNTIYFSSVYEKLTKMDSKGAFVKYGEERTMIVTMHSDSLNSLNCFDAIVANIDANYTVDLISLNLTSRLKYNEDPLDFSSDYNNGSNIAAGGLNTDIHKADILLRVKRSGGNFEFGTPLSDVPRSMFPRLRIGNKEGVNKEVTVQDLAGQNTDSAGRVPVGIATSGDLIQPDKVPYAFFDRLDNSSTTSIRHVWDQGNEWITPNYLLGDLGDNSPVPITFKPKFSAIFNGAPKSYPIKAHTLSMHVSKIKLTTWEPYPGSPVTRIITTNPGEVNEQANPPVILGDPEQFVSFQEQSISDSGDGTYLGHLQFHVPEPETVNNIWFVARDEGVYETKTQPITSPSN